MLRKKKKILHKSQGCSDACTLKMKYLVKGTIRRLSFRPTYIITECLSKVLEKRSRFGEGQHMYYCMTIIKSSKIRDHQKVFTKCKHTFELSLKSNTICRNRMIILLQNTLKSQKNDTKTQLLTSDSGQAHVCHRVKLAL